MRCGCHVILSLSVRVPFFRSAVVFVAADTADANYFDEHGDSDFEKDCILCVAP